MEIWRIAIVAVLVIGLGWGLFKLFTEEQALTTKVNRLQGTTESLEGDNKKLEEQIDYFKHPENLLKELKSQFNYREAGEQLIIIVPSTTSTSEQ